MVSKFLNFYIFKDERGVGIIDIMISVAVIGIAFFSISQVAILGLRIGREAGTKLEAIYLAEEGIEIARVLRDESWSGFIGGLNLGTDYFPSLAGSRWTLSETDPGSINNLFIRTLTFNRVCRDPITDNIVACSAPGAAEDVNTRELVSSVFWEQTSGEKVYRITTYLANFLSN